MRTRIRLLFDAVAELMRMQVTKIMRIRIHNTGLKCYVFVADCQKFGNKKKFITIFSSDWLQTVSDLQKFIVKNTETRDYSCSLCVFRARLPSKVRNHLEAMHFCGHFIYECRLCVKTFKGRNALNVHNSVFHKVTKS